MLAQRLGWNVAILLAAAGLVAALQPSGERKFADSQSLGGEDRYLTYLSTDKPLYRPGETLYVRGAILHANTHKPLLDSGRVPAIVEVKGPKGDVVASGQVLPEESVHGFSWAIPPEQAGGEYTVHVSYPSTGYAPADRKLDIRAYRAPRLKSQIKFLRDGYGPADEVAATLHIERAEGGIPSGAKVSASARVDGAEVWQGTAAVDSVGDCRVKFVLPADIRRGEGTLVLAIEDGGVIETASKTIPILLQTVDLTMYPEGGDLVAGLPNRIYLEAFTPAKKPADLAGRVLNDAGKEVATFRTEHEGRARFALTPTAGEKYRLQITEPAGIKSEYPLPEVKAEGVVVQTPANVTAGTADVKVQVAAAKAGKYVVTLKQRENELAKQTLELAAGKLTDVTLSAGDSNGVLMVTVWDANSKPLAERLTFRQPKSAVKVKISASEKQYVPGGKGKLTITTTDENGKPTSAVVGVTVTDDSVLEMIEKREQAPRMPAMVFLENDVRELADAHVYFDAANEKSQQAIDLLLGTQGWRRFAYVNVEKFLEEHGDAGRRVLALRLATIEEATKGAVLELADGIRFAAPLPRLEAAPAPAAADAPGAAPPEANAAAPPPAEDKKAEKGEARNRPVDEAKNEGKLAAGEQAQAAGGRGNAEAPRAPQAGLGLAQGGEKEAQLRSAMAKSRDRLERRIGAKDQDAAIRNDMIHVRVYAHNVRADRKPGERIDFTETLFWSAGVKTNEKGEATVEFGLSDAVTSFRVFADAFTSSGAIGSGSEKIDSVEPFYLEPKLPLEVTQGDLPRVPVSFVNATGSALPAGKFTVKAQTAAGLRDSELTLETLAAGARVRKLLGVTVGNYNGEASITLGASVGPYADSVTRKFMVRPLGFPQEAGGGGLLGPGETVTQEIEIPATLVARSMTTRICVYPTPLASMTEALERLIQEPCGCFEQTSSTVYPLVMAQQYFKSHEGVDPQIVERAARTLETGYARLLGFECKSGGFEWFGADPGHDALTAYGLMEFNDMSQVRPVDFAMLDRTRNWLLTQRDGKGGYQRKTHTLHTWLAEPDLAANYNTWALLEAGIKADLKAEIAFAREAGEKSANTYVVALAANVLALGGDKEGSDHLLDKLAGKQQANGSLKDATQSVVGSGGEALEIETTALAVLAWLKNPSYTENVEKGIKYLAEACKSGRYGSTQSTVLALKAIVAYDKSRAVPKAPGKVELVVDDKLVGEAVAFAADTHGAIVLPDASAVLTPGKHKVQVRMSDGSKMPYSLGVKYFSTKPNSSAQCKLHLQAKLRDTKLEEGKATEVSVDVTSTVGEKIPTPMAVIGIPGGLEVRHDQLKELVKAGTIDAYEVIGRDVVLYWRAFEKEQHVNVPISVVAAVPGTYTGPASRTYLYYTDEHKNWVDGLKVEITPKE